MLEVILRNILLQLDTIEVHGRPNVKTMNNVMDNIEALINVIEKGEGQRKEEAKDADHAEHGKDI